MVPDLDEDHRTTLAALAHMCAQYLSDEQGVLDHMWMGAGERAFKVLARHGLIEVDSGRGACWTEAGEHFLNAH
jgi:hypothetical protein